MGLGLERTEAMHTDAVLTEEMRLLLLCSHPCPPDAERRHAEVEACLARQPDLAEVLRLAQAHCCVPLLCRLLWRSGVEHRLPASFRDASRDVCRAVAARNAFLERHLAETAETLSRAGIACRAMKGAAVALLAYGDTALRSYDDLDVLVHTEEIPAARTALAEVGYRAHIPMSDAECLAQVRAGWDVALAHGSGEFSVELCPGVAPHYMAKLPEALFWAGNECVAVGGRELGSPPPDALLIGLCVHGAKHRWSRLAWISDVAGLIERTPPAAWGTLPDTARRQGVRRMVAIGLILARDVSGASLPGRLAAVVGEDPVADRLAAGIAAELVSGVIPAAKGRRDEVMFLLRTRERRRDRVMCLLRWACTPSHGDRRAVRLPPALYLLHRVVRPLRLLWLWLSPACRRRSQRAAAPARPVTDLDNRAGGSTEFGAEGNLSEKDVSGSIVHNRRVRSVS